MSNKKLTISLIFWKASEGKHFRQKNGPPLFFVGESDIFLLTVWSTFKQLFGFFTQFFSAVSHHSHPQWIPRPSHSHVEHDISWAGITNCLAQALLITPATDALLPSISGEPEALAAQGRQWGTRNPPTRMSVHSMPDWGGEGERRTHSWVIPGWVGTTGWFFRRLPSPSFDQLAETVRAIAYSRDVPVPSTKSALVAAVLLLFCLQG